MMRKDILNLGAGVQSTTLYLMFMQGRIFEPRQKFVCADCMHFAEAMGDCDFCGSIRVVLTTAAEEVCGPIRPHPIQLDCAIFADTQDEPQTVYRHLEWLESLNGPPILRRTRGRLSEDLKHGTNSTGQRFASIPAFMAIPDQEDEGRVRRQCSKEYKVEVIERCLRREVLGLKARQRIPKTAKVMQYVGISIDEAMRFERVKRNARTGEMRAPLIENFMTRENCKQWLKEFGNVPHEVPRSACVFCPFRDDESWMDIKNEPAEWAKAIEVDEALRTEGNVFNRGLYGELYLHRSLQPLVQIDFHPKPKDNRQISMPFWRDCMGVCGV